MELAVPTFRNGKHHRFCEVALTYAREGTCLRRNYGCVVVKNGRAIGQGWTGAPRGMIDCTVVGKCYRQDHNIPSGSDYSKCRSVHAEENGCINAGFDNTFGADLYIAGFDAKTGKLVDARPCFNCAKVMCNAKIKSVYMLMTDGSIVETTPQKLYTDILRSIFPRGYWSGELSEMEVQL